jgi:hypothetical protein
MRYTKSQSCGHTNARHRPLQTSCHYYWIVFVKNSDTAVRWCSQFQTLIITRFKTTVLTFSGWFQQIGTQPCGWQVSFPHYPAFKITLLSQDPTLIKWGWQLSCCTKWDTSSISKCNPKGFVFYWQKICTLFCVFLGHFTFSLLVFCKFLERNRHFTLKV